MERRTVLPFGFILPPIYPAQIQQYKASFEDGCRADCEECARHFRPVFEQTIDSRAFADEVTDNAVKSIASTLTEKILEDL